MTVTPIRAAKIANARRLVEEILRDRQCMYPEEAARLIVDELQKLGWAPPGVRDDDAIPQPATSSPGHRARVIAEAREAMAAAKKTRTAVNPEEAS